MTKQLKRVGSEDRSSELEDLVYMMQSWGKVKTLLYETYEQIIHNFDNAFTNCAIEQSDQEQFEKLKAQVKNILEEYYGWLVVFSAKLLNDDYKRKHFKIELTLLGEMTAVEQSVLIYQDAEGVVKISLPVSSKYDTIISIPNEFEVMMIGDCVLCVEDKSKDEEDAPEIWTEGAELKKDSVYQKEKTYITNFIPHNLESLYKNIYKVGSDAKIFFPKQNTDQVPVGTTASVILTLKPIMHRSNSDAK